MNRVLRSIGVGGLLVSVIGAIALVVNIGPQALQTNTIAIGLLVTLGSWVARENTTPPVSCVQWLLLGDAPQYSEMSEQRLQTHYTWITRRINRRETTGYKVNELLGLAQLHGYTTEQLEQAASECRTELESRGFEITTDTSGPAPSHSFTKPE